MSPAVLVSRTSPSAVPLPSTIEPAEIVIAPFAPKNVGLRSGPWVYISAQGDGGFGGMRGGPASLGFSQRVNSDVTSDGKIKPDASPDQLYHLGRDPQQAKNVVREEPAVAARLRAELKKYRDTPRTAPTP